MLLCQQTCYMVTRLATTMDVLQTVFACPTYL